MKPLHVALVVKSSPSTRERENRNMGYWSYPVPEFTWDHFSFEGGADASKLKDYDLIFQEDGGPFEYINRSTPLVYLSIDSTLSDDHYQVRLRRAKCADLVLVDHDQIERFPRSRRLAYCVNDHVFQPLEKSIDVSFHCGAGASKGTPGGQERVDLRILLDKICQEGGWSYRSGALPLSEYAESMGRSRIIVNWPRTPINRPHRVFDAMASGACLLTGLLPNVDGDYRIPTEHYTEFSHTNILPDLIRHLLKYDLWKGVARDGYEMVMKHHTWATRAKELRELLAKELGL